VTDGLTYSDVPDRIGELRARQPAKLEAAKARLASMPSLQHPKPNRDGDTETVGDVTVTHRFVEAPGDSEMVRWHLVECGPRDDDSPTIVFLHGLPDSWWEWNHALAHFGRSRHCIAVDLKGYGQSEKGTGDYRQVGVAHQLRELLNVLGIGRISLVAHDRGAVIADYLMAEEPYRAARYVRGQQHLWHLHPDLYPQEARFLATSAPETFSRAQEFVTATYGMISDREVSDDDLMRTCAEWSHEGVSGSVPRYFHSSSFRQEWVDRRRRLISAWKCPVLLVQGRHDAAQPYEYYTDAAVLERLPRGSGVRLLDAGHFWPLEVPDEANAVMAPFLE